MPQTHPYVALARRTVERLLNGEPLPLSGWDVSEPGDDDALWRIRRACFVSIKTTGGDLRGCIGTILPTRPSLDLEIIENAVSASTRDPRFPPMRADELAGVVFSVDVLGEPEPISDISALDPKRWGVIVSHGSRRGVLLPDLDGVDTAEQQLSIAAQKAGIYGDVELYVERFTVDRYKEA